MWSIISVTVLLALNFISLESLFISLYNDAPVVMNMHLWAEQHSWLSGWVPSEMWKMSLPMSNSAFSCWYWRYCFELNGGLDVFWTALFVWLDYQCFQVVHHDRSLHQSGHLVSAPSIRQPRLSNLEKARAIGQVEAGVPPESSCGIIWSEPWYHLQTEGKVLWNRWCQRQTAKWASQEDNTMWGSWLLLVQWIKWAMNK